MEFYNYNNAVDWIFDNCTHRYGFSHTKWQQKNWTVLILLSLITLPVFEVCQAEAFN